jgi:ADP-ribose pyrophosphatase YjhB (NUDIX family)
MKPIVALMISFLAVSPRCVIAGRAAFSTLLALPQRPRRNISVPRFLALSTTICLFAASSSSTSTFCADTDHHEFPSDVLELDSYNGVILKVNENIDKPDFESRLKASLSHWYNQGKRGIWVHIPPTLAHLVPVCTQLGFDFHFAKPGMLVLTKWLPEDSVSRLPNGPTHQVGIGALVLDEEQTKMLVVQEKSGPASEFKLWKMPTGLLDPGEDIGTAAQRELLEETGLDGVVNRILCFRQAHSGGDRGSDLFFVCLMKLRHSDDGETTKNVALVPQEEEIAAIQWMDIDAFCAQAVWQRSPVYLELNEAIRRALRTGTGLEERTLEVGFRPGTNAIYVPPSIL